MRSVWVFCRLVVVFVGMSLVVSSAADASRDVWPSRVSGLNGWHGFKLVKGVQCPECYSLVIPKTFGLSNENQLRILIELPKKKVDDSMAYDLDGPLFVDVDVLNHLLQLALDKKSLTAGRIILDPEKYGMLLGAETSEEIEGTHVIPLLRGFSDLNALIEGEAEYKRLARNICDWSAMNSDFHAANSLVTNLTKRQYRSFAAVLSSTCKAEKESLKKPGEEFAE